jgi:hypothetical protein
MRVGWPVMALAVVFAFGCSRAREVYKVDSAISLIQDGGSDTSERDDAADATRVSGNAGSDANSGGVEDAPSGRNDGGSIDVIDVASDTGIVEAGPDDSIAAFCSGYQARMVVNGIESNPVITGTALASTCYYDWSDCHLGGQFVITTQTFTQVIVVTWKAVFYPDTRYAAINLLQDLPEGWSVRVDVGCDLTRLPDCNSALDSYTSDLQGWLEFNDYENQGVSMTICLEVGESSDSEHSILHSLRLHAPWTKTR